MKERGIPFSAPLIGPVLAGTKTVTRRLPSPQPTWFETRHYNVAEPNTTPLIATAPPGWEWRSLFAADEAEFRRSLAAKCPYGDAGDRLWVREAWRTVESLDQLSPAALAESVPVHYEADRAVRGVFREPTGRYRHARFMPRWASRITLEVVSVRAERLHEITEDDAKAEGAPREARPMADVEHWSHRLGFATLWDEINGERAPWSSNPWVFRVEFRRLAGLTAEDVKAALAAGAEVRKAAEKTLKRSPRR